MGGGGCVLFVGGMCEGLGAALEHELTAFESPFVTRWAAAGAGGAKKVPVTLDGSFLLD